MRGGLALLLATVTAVVAGCAGNTETAAPPRETVTVTVTEPAPPPPPPPIEETYEDEEPLLSEVAATETFEGEYFSVEYPAEWTVETAEQSKGSYLDTTIRDTSDSNVMLRVDVTPEGFSAPETVAADVEGYLIDQPRYRRLRFQPTTFSGYDAFQWDFVVEEDGVLLRKSDIFFTTDTGDAVAVLIQAAAGNFRSRVGQLSAARDSLVVHGDGTYEYTEPDAGDSSEFCATHDCIENFEEGDGYVVECADGTWSQSGGNQGACSHHGGVLGSSGSSGSYDVDDNGDGSTYNWCGASRDGDGDGLWCEGR